MVHRGSDKAEAGRRFPGAKIRSPGTGRGDSRCARLALGAEIPQGADLHEFAPLVLDRVPQLQGYRFLVTGDQIVIVQRGDRSIALVIDRA